MVIQFLLTGRKGEKADGKDNDLLELIAADETFGVSLDELKSGLDPAKYTGCAAHQTERFINENVKPVLEKYKDLLGEEAEVSI